jgi:tetratricopeptide (TPR) repeat protein
VAAAYGDSLGGPFLYDDRVWITWNPRIHSLWPPWELLAVPPGSATYGRPLLTLSFALNYAVGAAAPWGYHLANLVLHALATLVLFGVVRRTLAYLPGTFPHEGGRTRAAFSAALLWAVHPLLTESVTYVAQRAESLMGLFYLFSLYAFIRAVQGPGGRPWLLASVLSSLAGMETKQAMVTAPVLILLYDRTFESGGFAEAFRRRGAYYGGLALTWLPLLSLRSGLRDFGVGYHMGFSWWSYGLTEAWVVGHYLLLSFWPYPLVFDYGADIVASTGQVLPWVLLLVALLAAALAGCLLRRSAAAFAVLAVFILLAPTSSVIPIAFEPMAESRMYLPLAALAACAGAAASLLLGRKALPLVLAAALLLGTASWLRNRDYRSEVALWADTVRRRPDNARARLALGSAFAQENRPAEAAAQFAAALRITPGDFEARLNYGLALYHLGRPDEALAQYRGLTAPSPDSPALHLDIGLALEAQGRAEEAIGEYRRALEIDPADIEARTNLGGVLFRAGRLAEASAEYRRALVDDPGSARAHYNLGMALDGSGGQAAAMAEYREAVRLEPGFAEAHNNLGRDLARAGRPREAVAEFEAALRIRPDYARARANLETLRGIGVGP